MEVVLDKIASELESISATASPYGGISDIITISGVKLFDPGWVLFTEYPFFIVEPVRDEQSLSTVGAAGRDVRSLTIRVTLLIDGTEYFNPMSNDAAGDRVLVKTASAVQRWFSRMSNKNLDNTVRGLSIPEIDYLPQERGEVFAKSAIITLVAEKSYQHEP